MEADAFLAYGVVLEDEYATPWRFNDDDNIYDVETWWQSVAGYEPVISQEERWAYAERGETHPKTEEYWEHRAKWMKDNPPPFEELIFQYWDYPRHLILPTNKKKYLRRAYYGDYEEIDPSALRVYDADRDNLLEDLKKYSIEYEAGPGWFLVGRLDP